MEKIRKEEEKGLINALMHYLIENKNEQRTTTSYRINSNVRDRFFFVCRQHRLLFHGRVNVALEGLMQVFIDFYENKTAIQLTLDNLSVERKKRELLISERLELKLIKTDLKNILEAMEIKRGHEDYRYERFREILPKAIRLYEETRDKEIGELLEKAEQWV